MWGYDEYSGIAAELGARIDAAGGWLTVDDLIADVLASAPDVTEASVKAYMYRTLGFVVDSGMVRRRREGDALPTLAPLSSVRGAIVATTRFASLYQCPPACCVVRAQPSPLPRRAHSGSPGGQREFDCPHRRVSVIWRLESSVGAVPGISAGSRSQRRGRRD